MRPNNSAAIGKHVQGLREAKAAFMAMPAVMREHLGDATETTVREIARGAQSRLASSPSVRTRNLYNAIAWAMNRKNGRGKVGIKSGSTTFVSAGRKIRIKGIAKQSASGSWSKVDQPSKRAHFVEFGTRKMSAEPFMVPAANAEKRPHLERCERAGKAFERDIAAIGMRNT